MIGSRIPRLLLHAFALGIAGAAIMLSLFYSQYWWLANQIESASYAEQRSLLEASFERRARADLHAIAHRLPDDLADVDTRIIHQELNRGLTVHPELIGIRLASAAGETWSSGSFPQDVIVTKATWLEEQLLLTFPVDRDGKVIGELTGSFELDTLKSELAAFAARLKAREDESRRVSFIWIGGGTLAVLIVCLSIVWLYLDQSCLHNFTWSIRQNIC